MDNHRPYKDEVIISWTELQRDAKFISNQLLSIGSWKGIIAITKGGLIPSALIARELDIKLIDTVCVSSYSSDTDGIDQKQNDLEVIKMIDGAQCLHVMFDITLLSIKSFGHKMSPPIFFEQHRWHHINTT